MPEISFDKRRMQQVLLNILSNAIKFTNEGTIIIRVYLIRKGTDNFLEISVKDEGIGMKSCEMSDIFTRFKRSNNRNSRNRNRHGNGVGLSICKHICQQLGGDITVDSVANIGSVFKFQMKVYIIDKHQSVL